MEISTPEIYNTPLPNGKTIVRVDTLACLRKILGDEPFICRDFLYTMLSGSNEKYSPTDVFASFYRKYPKITQYVNEKYNFGDESIPIVERCILPLRDEIKEYKKHVMDMLSGKYLVETHDYVYFAFNVPPKANTVEGMVIIC